MWCFVNQLECAEKHQGQAGQLHMKVLSSPLSCGANCAVKEQAFKDRETCQDAPGVWPGHNCSIIIQASHCKRNDMSVHMIYNILYCMVYTTYAIYHAISHTINHLHIGC